MEAASEGACQILGRSDISPIRNDAGAREGSGGASEGAGGAGDGDRATLMREGVSGGGVQVRQGQGRLGEHCGGSPARHLTMK